MPTICTRICFRLFCRNYEHPLKPYGAPMNKIAVAVMCKTPAAGASKTRLSPPLLPAECAAISACFIRDLTQTIGELSEAEDVVPYALYTPIGTERELLQLL